MFVKIHRKQDSVVWTLTIDGKFIMSAMFFEHVCGEAIGIIARDGEDIATVDIQVIDDESLTKRKARRDAERANYEKGMTSRDS